MYDYYLYDEVVYDIELTYDIDNTPRAKAFSVIAESSTYYAKGSAPSNPVVDGDCTYSVTNDGSVVIDISIHGHDFTGGAGWAIKNTVGVDEVVITAYKVGDNPSADGVKLTTSGQAFISNLGVGQTIKWDFKLETGTFTDGQLKTANITLTSVVH
jgi:hypothetical protein